MSAEVQRGRHAIEAEARLDAEGAPERERQIDRHQHQEGYADHDRAVPRLGKPRSVHAESM